ncbi:MAG: hypothetical protein LQ348_006862 [Seirophora lacunosa]|nr:MAG: hypothetical protein LQ348_006862 [Seirophora lacunosa]
MTLRQWPLVQDPVKLRQKGQEVDKLPYTAEKNYKADEIQKKFNDNYKVEDLTDDEDNFLEPFLDDDVEEAFKDLGIAKLEDARFREMEVSSVGDAGPIAQAKYFPEKGIILGEARFSDRDLTPQDQKLRPSDITFLQWKDAASRQAKVDFKAANPAEPKTPDEIKAAGDALAAAEAKAVKTMRAFVGRVIASKSTVESMQTAQRQTGQLLADTSRFERGADTQGKRDAFDLMMGTDFISSLNHMLRDHAPALGKKQISSIVAYPRTFDGEKGRKDIAITVNFEDIP